MKTLTDGYFYNPTQAFSLVKVEEWFSNASAIGDQTGLNVAGYPFQFPDNQVNLADLVLLANSYCSGSQSEGWYFNQQLHWNYQADIAPNRVEVQKVQLKDLVVLALRYGRSSPSWYNTDISHISLNFTITGNPQPTTKGLDNGFVAVPQNCTSWIVFRNDTNIAVGAFLTFWS
jgi:hypothetical protein